jgi:hypothetical protein
MDAEKAKPVNANKQTFLAANLSLKKLSAFIGVYRRPSAVSKLLTNTEKAKNR